MFEIISNTDIKTEKLFERIMYENILNQDWELEFCIEIVFLKKNNNLITI